MSRVVKSIVTLAAVFVSTTPAVAQRLETVIEWNRATLTALAVPGANPSTVFVTRPLAMVSVAVFDAANAFDGVYHPYAGAPAPGRRRVA